MTQNGHHGPAAGYAHRKPEIDVYFIDQSSKANLSETLFRSGWDKLKSPSKALGHYATNYDRWESSEVPLLG